MRRFVAFTLLLSCVPALAFSQQRFDLLSDSGANAYQVKDYAKAERCYSDALKELGAGHEPDKATALTNLAVVEAEQHKCGAALSHFQTALELKTNILGLQNVSTLNTLRHYIRALRKCGHDDLADKLQSFQLNYASKPNTGKLPQISVARSNVIDDDQVEQTHIKIKTVETPIKIICTLTSNDQRTIRSPQTGTREVLDHYEQEIAGYDFDSMGNRIPRYYSRPVYRTESYVIWRESDLEYYKALDEISERHGLASEFERMQTIVRADGAVLEFSNGWVALVDDLPDSWHTSETAVIAEHPRLNLPFVLVQNESTRNAVTAELMNVE